VTLRRPNRPLVGEAVTHFIERGLKLIEARALLKKLDRWSTRFTELPIVTIPEWTYRAAGMNTWDAVVTAATHRIRSILLTASAAILGMIPIAPTVFWEPMAFAIIGGLAGATALTLIFLPTLYVKWFRVKAPHDSEPEGQTKSSPTGPLSETRRPEPVAAG
jgi:hypothetical protein